MKQLYWVLHTDEKRGLEIYTNKKNLYKRLSELSREQLISYSHFIKMTKDPKKDFKLLDFQKNQPDEMGDLIRIKALMLNTADKFLNDLKKTETLVGRLRGLDNQIDVS